MKLRNLFAGLALFALATLAHANPALPTLAAYSQAESLAFMVALDEEELAVARQALGRPIDPAIRGYAEMLVAEHSRNLAATRAIARAAGATLVDTADVQASRNDARAGLEQLGLVNDDEYGSRFLQAIASSHTEALELIDERLLPSATDPRVAQHLQSMRIRMAAHQQRANELLSAGK